MKNKSEYLRKSLTLQHRLVAEIIHDNAWSEDDLKRMALMSISEQVTDLEQEMYDKNECPECGSQYAITRDAGHESTCMMKAWLELKEQAPVGADVAEEYHVKATPMNRAGIITAVDLTHEEGRLTVNMPSDLLRGVRMGDPVGLEYLVYRMGGNQNVSRIGQSCFS